MDTATLPKMTSLGLDLDTSPEQFGELQSSLDIMDDPAALRERMQEEGYLYLPGLLDRDEVFEARGECVRRLAEAGAIDLSYPAMDAIINEAFDFNTPLDLVKDNAELKKVLYSGRMMEFYTRFLGGEVRHFDFTWMRVVQQGPLHSTNPHCDIVYMGRGTTNLFTAWTPLGDLELENGVIMLLEKSHRHERLNNNYGRKDVDTFCTNRRPENFKAMGGGGNIARNGSLTRNPVKLRQNLGGRWLTTNYRAGDVLTFTMYTVHSSTDNQTNKLRLSTDSRYQLASDPIDERWVGENPIGHGPNAKKGMIC